MLSLLLRMLAVLGPTVEWTAIYVAVVIAIFVIYIGWVLRALIRATEPKQRDAYLQALRELVRLFRPGKRQ